MPKIVTNALSPAKVKHETDPGAYADGNGLYLLVTRTGAKFWIWRGTIRKNGATERKDKRREISIGPVRLYSLEKARKIAAEWARLAWEGVDPRLERDKHKRASLTLEEAARRVWSDQIKKHGRSEKYRQQWIAGLETHVFPTIGQRPVNTIEQSDILNVLSPLWSTKGKTARHLRQRLRVIFDWAKVAGHYPKENPVQGIEAGLPKHKPKVQHYPALPWQEIPGLMRRLEGENAMSALCLRFVVLTAARSGEVRGARWSEVDLDNAEWIVPASRLKGGQPHRVPLSSAALAVLQAGKGLAPDLVFPSRIRGAVMSDNTLLRLLQRMEVPAVPHGMRSSFRDWCEEATSYPYEVKEAALAHTVKSATERAYRRTDLFEKRRELMEIWGRFCTTEPAEVVELRA